MNVKWSRVVFERSILKLSRRTMIGVGYVQASSKKATKRSESQGLCPSLEKP